MKSLPSRHTPIMVDQSFLFPDGAVFTVTRDAASGEDLWTASPGRADRPENDQSFDLAIIEFDDHGLFVDPHQEHAAVDCIAAARRSNRNGVLVVVFVHGWHHSAQWDGRTVDGDSHFASFRKVLATLTLREAERYGAGASGRRVVGVYLAWQGDPASWSAVLRESWLTHLSFFGRYRTAKSIGGGADLRRTIRDIVDCAKSAPPPDTPNQPESPLALIGHSMGALMLESALLALFTEDYRSLVKPVAANSSSCVQVTQADEPVSFPDIVIALNSAADSRITKAIVTKFKQCGLSKSVRSGTISYSPPLFVSATSTDDWTTKMIWRLAPGNVFRRTGGHDKKLFTHRVEVSDSHVVCTAKRGLDFGQSWSCLRVPTPPGAASPEMPIDLPDRERSEQARASHRRYRLVPLSGHEQARPAWIFQLPPRISAEHNDIFNARASLFLLALMQISGAVMSLAEDWERNFEAL